MTATTTLLEAGHGPGRLLVRAPDGRRLGWHDLASGTTHLTETDAGPLVADAVARHVARCSPLRSRRMTGLVPAPRAATAVPVVHRPRPDLRDREPGATRVSELVELLELLPPRPEPTLTSRLLRRHRLPDRARSLLVDALVAQDVAAELRCAGAWTVLHDVPVGGGDVLDHLLLGPGGALVLGRVSARAPHTGESTAEAAVAERVGLVREVLTRAGFGRVVVQGAVITARRGAVASTPPRVARLRVQDLTAHLGALPRVVSSVDLGRFVDVAARRSFWPGTEDDIPGARDVAVAREDERAAFDRLLADLRLHRRRRADAGSRTAARIRG